MSEHGGDASSQRSGNSGASGLSETSSQRSDTKFLKKRGPGVQTRNEEEADVLEQKRNIQEGVFACMYTLVRQTAMSHWKYAFLKVVLEFLMNFIVAFNPTFAVWQIDKSNPVWQFIRWTVWRQPIQHNYGYKTYITIMYVMVAAVFLAIVGLAWLTLAMRKQEQSKLLRIAALGLHVVYDILFMMCYVSFFDYFTFVADCDWAGDKSHVYFGVACLKMPHLLHLLVAETTALLFMCVTALVVVASCDLDPVSRGLLASPAAYVRLKILVAKAIFIILSNCLDSNIKIQSVGMLAMAVLIVFWNLKGLPFYYTLTNIVWTGLWGGILYTCVLLTIMVYGKNQSTAYFESMTMNVLYGVGPAICVVMAVTGLYAWWAMRPACKFKNLGPGVKLSKVYKFASVYEVERLARVMRKFDADGVVDEDKAALGETIIKAGLQVFPNAPHLLILYANFVLEVRKDGPAARTQLQLVGKQMPNMVERYQVFCTNEASKRLKDSQEEGMDLQAYIEFKRNLRAVLRVHKEVLLHQSELWLLCMRTSLRVAQIDSALDALETATARADQVYRRVLERYPGNGKLLRCYGKFLEDVRNDQVAASRAYAGANRVGANSALLSLDFGGGAHGTKSGKPDFLTSMSMEDDAVVVIDAEGTIMMVSQAVQRAFGYPKVELEGANVALLMPQPFSQRHAGYMQRYTSTGESHILDTVREVVALHKERYVFPINLCVTKLSGVGSDSIFLGVIRPLPSSVLSIRAWVSPNGVFLCADQQFSSAIGMLEGDLVGHPMASLAMDPEAVAALLERCQVATVEELEAGSITTELTLRHRFLDPVPFLVEVRMAGSDAQRILVLHCRRTDGQDGSMIAVDTHMRVKFASCEVALLLGYSMRKLASMRLDQLLPPPFNALHAKWLRDPPHTSRPGSCRTGAVVHLLSDAGTQVPVRLTINTLEVEAATGGTSATVTLYVVKVTKLAPDELFKQKRLVLTADFSGRVLTVSPPDSDVFEFPATSLAGSNLADCVDIFADWRERSGETQMQMILLALLGKEQEMPGTSWRVRVHEPRTSVGGGGDHSLPPIAGAARGAEPRHVSRSACLQVELEEDADEGDGSDSGVRVQVTLWRRDLLTGVLELDEDLVVRRASPLTGLITGLPTTAMLRKPLSSFLNIPSVSSWDKLVAAASSQPGGGGGGHHHKKSALKATPERGSISPVMAFIGPHPDTGTMRLMVQGVQTLGPGGRAKVTLTMHPDTTFTGAHANLMRVLRLEGSYNGGGLDGGDATSHDDALSHIGRQTRASSAAASMLRSQSLGAAAISTAAQQSGLAMRSEDRQQRRRLRRRRQRRGQQHGNGTGGAGGEGEGRAGDGEGGGGRGDDGDEDDEDDEEEEEEDDDSNTDDDDDDDRSSSRSSTGLMAQATSLHRQATSKSEFVEQWVRSITQQANALVDEEQQQKRQQQRSRRGGERRRRRREALGKGPAEQGDDGSGEPTGPLRHEPSSLLALQLGPQAGVAAAAVPSTAGAGAGAVAPSPRTTCRLATVLEDPSLADEESVGGGKGGSGPPQVAASQPRAVAAPGQPRRAGSRDGVQQRAMSRALSFAAAEVPGGKSGGGGAAPQQPALDARAPSGAGGGEDGGGKGAAKGGGRVSKDDSSGDEKSDKGSDMGGSSVDDGSQAASAISSATDGTSVSEVVIDARRARLLKALNKVMLGPALMVYINRMRTRSYMTIAALMLMHLVSYVVITSLIKMQYKNVYSVHRQALAMDRSQLVVVRTVLGTFCERANVTARVAGCAYPLSLSVSKLVTNVLLMEQYHQGVYMGFDTAKVSEPARAVYSVWTDPNVDYQVFLDTKPAQVLTDSAGAWLLGNRFIAAAREAVYWLPQYKDNFVFHRTYSFIVSNGLGPLFQVYAKSLDYLVLAAWQSIGKLRQDVLIFMAIEALALQLACAVYTFLSVMQLEAARMLGALALVALPGPVLRQLTAVETKILHDSDDDSDGEGSLAGSDDNLNGRGGAAGGGGAAAGGSGRQGSLQHHPTATVSIAPPDAPTPPLLLPPPGASKAAPAAAAADGALARKGSREVGGGYGGTADDDTARKSGSGLLLLPAPGQEGAAAAAAEDPAAQADVAEERRLGGRGLRTMRRFRMSRKRSPAGGDAAAAAGGRGMFGHRFQFNGKTLLPSYATLFKFMTPFSLWSLAVLAVYIVTLTDLNDLQAPLSELNLASRITYRYTRLRAIGAAFVVQDFNASKDAWRAVLSAEVDTFESEYNALMYGGIPSSMANSVFARYVPAATFSSAAFARIFFRMKGCMRYNTSACFPPGDPYYEITHNGLDAMVRRMVYEMRLLSLDDNADVTYNSSRYAYTSIVGANDLYEGLQQAAQLFVDFLISHYNKIITVHTVLMVMSILVALFYLFFVLRPHVARLLRDAARQSALLSHVPPEMDVRAHVRAVFRRGAPRKRAAAAGGGGGRGNAGKAAAVAAAAAAAVDVDGEENAAGDGAKRRGW